MVLERRGVLIGQTRIFEREGSVRKEGETGSTDETTERTMATMAMACAHPTLVHRRRTERHVVGRRMVCRATSDASVPSSHVGVQRRYAMLGGKGGVGKTSMAASLALRWCDQGHPTLVVSTDPAHSLSDSLAQDVSGGSPVEVEGTDGMLYGMEVDPIEAREEFRRVMRKDDGKGVQDFMGSFGLGGLAKQLEELKLGELLDTPPPGFDEVVALSRVFKFLEDEKYARFTRIIFDTAPTGHTLRLLSLPDFIDVGIGKLFKLRRIVGKITGAIKGFFGGQNEVDPAEQQLENLKRRLEKVREVFHDPINSEFMIVCIPTVMAINESRRLLHSLKKEGVPVHTLVINQMVPPNKAEKFFNMRRKDQERSIAILREDPELKSLYIIQAPLLDLEVRGIGALQYFGEQVWKTEEAHLDEMLQGKERKYFFVSGKGGVGKTSLSSSLALEFAKEGHQTLLVSTDPAHSLSDSLAEFVGGGKPVPVAGTDLPIFGMEIDPEEAADNFKAFVGESKRVGKILDSLGSFSAELKDLKLGELLETAPPGLDEAVAIARVIDFAESEDYARFSRIVIDTAPTGHTLRLLTLPEFLDASLEKILSLRKKIAGASSTIQSLFGVSPEEQQEAIKSLESLQRQVRMVGDLFRNVDATEFIIATIPTSMATSESSRLAKTLHKEGIPLKRVVVNQTVSEDNAETFYNMKRNDQERSMDIVRKDTDLNKLTIIQAELLDLEVRGVPGLRYFGSQVWKDE